MKTARTPAGLALLAFAMLFPFSTTRAAEAPATPPDAAFTRLASDATYGCRRPHGYGLYDPVVDKTFVCWNGPGMSVMGRSYDHATGQWTPEQEIHRLEYYGTWDYHNYPNMAQAPDGSLLVTWADHSDNLQLARSPAPHEMEGDWEYQLIEEENNCYPMIITVGERVYIFYSQTKDIHWPYRPFGYVYSDDSGRTWSKHIPAIDSAQQDPDRIDEVYAFHDILQPADGEHPDRVHFVWVMRGGPNGHNMGSRNAYFATFLPESGTWQSADGTDLGELIDFDEMLAHCVLVDTGPQTEERLINRVLVSWYPDGTPFVVYNLRKNSWLAVWEDGAWKHEQIADLYAKDLERMPDGSHRLLLAPGTQVKVEIREQQHRGDPWVKTFEREIPYDNGADRTWSMGFIDNARPEVDILMSQLKIGQEKKDYSGKWPVWSVDTSSAEEPQP
ncbi:BNR-4 repeat-containing protein [Ruficoccus sp. ZRK36]|uniref:BNR-4 repeat-containing protein n=1 Tax=Ruficoccus sp. ZRK36 TaxID=2866311 RepID=UPI001C737425|nr:BNR-4 repeat-containing protein [Ruficoccus sp. ZRK36]QYY35805.1 BNR repeat-containing protein [Ruficoccus sp. ZRK36]